MANEHQEEANQHNQEHQHPQLMILYDYISHHMPSSYWPMAPLQYQFLFQVEEIGPINPIAHSQEPPVIAPEIRYYEVRHNPQHDQQFLQHLEPIFMLQISQGTVSFMVARRFGIATIISAISLRLCNNYDDFRGRLRQSFEIAVGQRLNNPTSVEYPIPGYNLTYHLREPRVDVNVLDEIPWEEFRTRLSLVNAEEI